MVIDNKSSTPLTAYLMLMTVNTGRSPLFYRSDIGKLRCAFPAWYNCLESIMEQGYHILECSYNYLVLRGKGKGKGKGNRSLLYIPLRFETLPQKMKAFFLGEITRAMIDQSRAMVMLFELQHQGAFIW